MGGNDIRWDMERYPKIKDIVNCCVCILVQMRPSSLTNPATHLIDVAHPPTIGHYWILSLLKLNKP
jgi:hypothetical protein